MNKCLSLVHLITICLLLVSMASAQTELPQARVVNLSVDPEQVVVLHVRPGYVSSVRVLEEVSSVVLGDPGVFKAEHSEDEPQLVFFKATSTTPAQTNALITTRGARVARHGSQLELTFVLLTGNGKKRAAGFLGAEHAGSVTIAQDDNRAWCMASRVMDVSMPGINEIKRRQLPSAKSREFKSLVLC
jgi:hypothetical protein